MTTSTSPAKTIGTLQLAAVKPYSSRGKRAMIGFDSLHLRDTLHSLGQVDRLIRCQLDSLDQCFPHVDLNLENLLTVGIQRCLNVSVLALHAIHIQPDVINVHRQVLGSLQRLFLKNDGAFKGRVKVF